MAEKKISSPPLSKRDRILEVAGKMFIFQGYNGVSMEAIAEAAPVSKPTLYNHFDDKKALFAAVMLERCNVVFQLLQQSLRDDRSPEEALTEMARQFLEMVLKPDAISLYRIAITEAQNFPEFSKTFYENGPLRSRAVLIEYLDKMNKKGELKINNPELAAHAFVGMALSRFQMPMLLNQRKEVTSREINDAVHEIVSIFLNGVRAQ